MKRIQIIAYKHNFHLLMPSTYIGGAIALWQKIKGKKHWQVVHTANYIFEDGVFIEADISTGVEIYNSELAFRKVQSKRTSPTMLQSFPLACDYLPYKDYDYDLAAVAEQITGDVHAHNNKMYCSALSAKLIGLADWYRYMPADVVEHCFGKVLFK